jgi:predicted ArsR family transcriptional regulator
MDELSVKDFAEILGITVQAVHKMLARGVISARKHAGVFFIKRSELAKAQRRKGRGRPRKD